MGSRKRRIVSPARLRKAEGGFGAGGECAREECQCKRRVVG